MASATFFVDFPFPFVLLPFKFNFGAFVDVGVHQDGLVHISQLADRYVSDPREVVRSGQPLKVTVLEVDLDRKRISLSARSDAGAEARSNRDAAGGRASAPRASHKDRRGHGARDRKGGHASAKSRGKTEGGARRGSGGPGSSKNQSSHSEDLKHNPFAALLKR